MEWVNAKYGDIQTARLAKCFDMEISWSTDRSKPGYCARFNGLRLTKIFQTRDEAKQALIGLARSRFTKALSELIETE